jgi:hypothetical protein
MMRVAGAAALGTAAYQAGERHEQQSPVNEESQQAFAATLGPPEKAQVADSPVKEAPTAPGTTTELERLAQLHDSGALTDAEFSAAKSQLLGI